METINIPLSGSIGVAQAEQLHASIREGLQSGDVLQFDFTDARDVDASILQLLIAAKAACEESEKSVQWIGVSEQLANSLQRSGADEILGISDSDDAASDQEAEVVAAEPDA
ncbi:STAS domain-containing protein [Stieleria sp. JC731]|uniref:STAS domain-containing protein n=1 Tax=Pirellulaceae TaxID=2691357 RepID=UPI001E63729D|nr:STAS domain-containing protein [Stieleria sp. JC731]MCC9601208.1 STAS domain-containing protein [Stieleria sp. JC731]